MESGPLSRQLGDNVRFWRKNRDLSLGEVSARVTALGFPLSLNGLSKVELGNRGVDLDELVAVARALDVPPLLLIFPIGRQQTVEVLPGMEAPTWPAALWFAGDEPFPGERYGPNSPIRDFRAQDEQIGRWYRSKKRAEDYRQAAAREPDAEKRDEQMKVAELEDDTRERLIERDLRLMREHIRGWGLDPGALPSELAHVDGGTDGQR